MNGLIKTLVKYRNIRYELQQRLREADHASAVSKERRSLSRTTVMQQRNRNKRDWMTDH